MKTYGNEILNERESDMVRAIQRQQFARMPQPHDPTAREALLLSAAALFTSGRICAGWDKYDEAVAGTDWN